MDDHPLNKLKSFSFYKSQAADYFQSTEELKEFNDHLEQLFSNLDSMLEVILGQLPDGDLRISCQHKLLGDLRDDLAEDLPKGDSDPALSKFDTVINKLQAEGNK